MPWLWSQHGRVANMETSTCDTTTPLCTRSYRREMCQGPASQGLLSEQDAAQKMHPTKRRAFDWPLMLDVGENLAAGARARGKGRRRARGDVVADC
mmetsp:Transcript_8613/g.19205  ORF Transcript_8613/g.19205 Transcript_8613/m.19205 type:complete len:96 (-) Transcript_8613:129-416(-)